MRLYQGITLAKTLALPEDVIEKASEISRQLSERMTRQKKGSQAHILARKRKAILKLKEMLFQARDANLDNNGLASLLMRLQEEFIAQMTGTEEEQ